MDASPKKHFKDLNQYLVRAMLVPFLALLAAITTGCLGLPAPEPTATPTAIPTPTEVVERESWVLLNNLPDDATQVETGAEIYRLVCKACHGDLGQGLTPDWLAQWDPEDRNCWQSKCHNENHPPDGFTLPYYNPPVKGPQIAAKFATALDLYHYNRDMMPWHAPDTMLESEYWDVTAYLLTINGVDLGDTVLNESNAAAIRLR